MLHVKSYEEILEILLQNVADEGSHHVAYVSNEEDITELLTILNASTDAVPELVNFDNNGEKNYFVLELDYNEDDKYSLTYSIWPARDEKGIFYPNYGLCLVDANVPEKFEKDYNRYADRDEFYIGPLRISRDNKKPIVNSSCVNCNNKCSDKTSIKTSEQTRIDTDNKGKLTGFKKSWTKNNSHFTYSFHSTNEDNVVELMKRFGIKK